MITEAKWRGGGAEYPNSPAFQMDSGRKVHVISATAGLTFALVPDARGVGEGTDYLVVNVGGATLTVRNVLGTDTIGTVGPFTAASLGCLDDETSEGRWQLVEIGPFSASADADVSEAVYALGDTGGSGTVMERYRPIRQVWEPSVPPPFDSRQASVSRSLTGSPTVGQYGLLLSGGNGSAGSTVELQGGAWQARASIGEASEDQAGAQGDGGGCHRMGGTNSIAHRRWEGDGGLGAWNDRTTVPNFSSAPTVSEIRDDAAESGPVALAAAEGTVDPAQRARFGVNQAFHQPFETTAGSYQANLFFSIGGWFSESDTPFSINLVDDGRQINLDESGTPTSLLAGQKLTCSLYLDLGAIYSSFNGTFFENGFVDSAPVYPHVSGVNYIITWTGGEMEWISFGDAVSMTRLSANRWRFQVTTATFTGIRLGITSIDQANPPQRGTLRMFREDKELILASEPWDPEFLADLDSVGVARFMESSDLNTNQYQGGSPLPDDYLIGTTKRGWPASKIIDLCNRANVSPWYCAPIATGSIHDRAELTLFRDGLAPGLVLQAEKGNEAWNFWPYILKDGLGGDLFPPSDHGGKRVWVSSAEFTSPLVFPGLYTGTQALDLRPHSAIDDTLATAQGGQNPSTGQPLYQRVNGVPTWNGLTMYEVGPLAIDPTANTDEAAGYEAMRVQAGRQAEAFHQDVDFVFGAGSTRKVNVFGTQWAGPALTTTGVANNPSCEAVAGAPYNPTIPTRCGETVTRYGQTWTLDDADTCFAYMDAAHTFTDPAFNFPQNVVTITDAAVAAVNSVGRLIYWYEVGHQWLAQNSQSAMELLVEIMGDSRMQGQTKRLLDTLEAAAPGSLIVWYNDYEKGSPGGGQYGAKRYRTQPIGEVPKWRAILDFLGFEQGGGGGDGPAPNGDDGDGFSKMLLTDTNDALAGRSWVYTVESNTWNPTRNRPGGGASASAMSGAIDPNGQGASLYSGGRFGDGAATPEVWMFQRSPTGIEFWQPQIPFQRGRRDAGSVFCPTGGRAHVVGGNEGAAALDDATSFRGGVWRPEVPKLAASDALGGLVGSTRKNV